MKTKLLIAGLVALALGGAYATANGKITIEDIIGTKDVATEKVVTVKAPAVSVAKVAPANFVETAFVTGSLIPRNEILVAPEVEGLRVLTLTVEEGDRVAKDQVLATLVKDTLQVQLSQNSAALARRKAVIAQAKSLVTEAQARLSAAKAQLDRARPLKRKGILSGAVYDERQAAASMAKAQLASAHDGIAVAEADLAQDMAQRRDIEWRLARTEIRAPAAGIVSRRAARVGALATGAGDPMFRIIQDGEIELDGEITETQISKVKTGMKARLEVAGVGTVEGIVRIVSPEVSRQTRLGHVRITLEQNTSLKIGAFARGTIETARNRGLGIPMAAVMYTSDAKHVLRVDGDKVQRRQIKTGLQSGGLIEVTSGLSENDRVVAKAGTFLRDGDRIRAVVPDPVVSEARR